METQRIEREKPHGPSAILVHVEEGENVRDLRFTGPFRIGRGRECQVVVEEGTVSREHTEIFPKQNLWWIRDLQSTNGTYVNGERIDEIPLLGKAKVTLGSEGLLLTLEVEGGDLAERTISAEGQAVPEGVKPPATRARKKGIRYRAVLERAMRRSLRLQARKYVRIIGGLAVLAAGALLYAYYSHSQLEKQRAMTQDIFYQMKDLELAYGRLESKFAGTQDTAVLSEMAKFRDKRQQLLDSYDRLIGELGMYSEKMDEKEKSIYRVARIFGECEVAMPEGFVQEVMNYVNEWKKSGRLVRSIGRAVERRYVTTIANTMLAHSLPPQFFYMALQESEFDSSVCGPQTRFGIAKGIWQFIPATAIQYGLKTGPLVHMRKVDPRDERHRVSRSTEAAARYIRDIYNGEAQASGLLVIASYNWGHNVVRGLVNQMPENPRERNFWKFLDAYRDKIPKQTYDYVFYIFSATVIGENPRLFGFQLDNPLASTEGQEASAG